MHCGPGETIPVSTFDQSVCDGIEEISGLGYFGEEKAFSASWVQMNGIKYEMESMLITSIVQEFRDYSNLDSPINLGIIPILIPL